MMAPLPLPDAEPPPARAWCRAGTPPDGFEFLGAVATEECFLMVCPACLIGWVAIVPDGTRFGYRLASEIGCSAGCDPPEVAWWHLWRLGELPPPPPPGERARRYAAGAIRRTLADLPERPSRDQLRRVAFDAGRWLEAGGLSTNAVARVLLDAAGRAALDGPALSAELAASIQAGRAQPGRVPA